MEHWTTGGLIALYICGVATGAFGMFAFMIYRVSGEKWKPKI